MIKRLILWVVALAAFVLLMLASGVTQAHAAPLIVGHRGARTTTVPESTKVAYEYAVKNGVGMLEGDVRWTKDSSDADTVGTMIIFHDATLDRTTRGDCTGAVADTLWSKIRDNCFTGDDDQPVLKMKDLVSYARSVNKPILFHMKVNMNSAQAKQFWAAAKIAPSGSFVAGSKSRIPGIQLVKKIDASSSYTLRYGYETSGNPTVSYVKSVGAYLVIEDDPSYTAAEWTANASRIADYKKSGLKVYLYSPGDRFPQTETDFGAMYEKSPNGVIVDDPRRYASYLANR